MKLKLNGRLTKPVIFTDVILSFSIYKFDNFILIEPNISINHLFKDKLLNRFENIDVFKHERVCK
jgi:hypothetical protein